MPAGLGLMRIEAMAYTKELWRELIAETLNEHAGLTLTGEQLDGVAKDIAGAASVEGEATGEYEQTRGADSRDDELAKIRDYARRLEIAIGNMATNGGAALLDSLERSDRALAARLGVVYVPCGTAHAVRYMP